MKLVTHTRHPLNTHAFWHGVSFRLRASLVVLALLSVLAVVTGFVGFRSSASALAYFEVQILPTLEDSEPLELIVKSIDTEARNLYNQSTTFSLDSNRYRLQTQLDLLNEKISLLDHQNIPADMQKKLHFFAESLHATLQEITDLLSQKLVAEQAQADTLALLLESGETLDGASSADGAGESLTGTSALRHELRQLIDLQLSVLALERPKLVNHYKRMYMERLDAVAKRFATDLTSRSDAPQLHHLKAFVTRGDQVFVQRVALLRLNHQAQAVMQRLSAVNGLMETSKDISGLMRQRVKERIQTVYASQERMGRLLMLIFGLAMVFAAMVIIYVNRHILRRLGKLYEAMLAQVAGKHVPVDIGGADEISDMGHCFDHFVHVVRDREAALSDARDDAEGAKRAVEKVNSFLLTQAEVEKRSREEQKKLLQMLAHEIKTPITVIAAATQSLEVMEGEPAAARNERYDRIHRAIKRLDDLLNTALQRKDDEFSEHPLQLSWVNAVELTLRAASVAQDTHRIRIDVRPRGAFSPIQVDPQLLTLALLNLLDNACKYSPAGAVVHVDLVQERRAERAGLLWQVFNQGPPIPAGMDEVIFEKYKRVGETQGVPGLGLGLYLTRHIIERHGGEIGVLRTVAQGTCIAFWLPDEQPGLGEEG